MTLLDDLQSLDLSAVLDAKASISVTVNSESILDLTGNGAAETILGDLGTTISTAVAAVEDPEQIAASLLEAATQLLGELDLGDLPIAEFIEAMSTAARILAQVVEMLSGDPAAISPTEGGGSLGGFLEAAGGAFGDHASVVSGGLSRLRALIATAESGLPSDPGALLEVALQILVPLDGNGLEEARSWSSEVQAQLDGIGIDPDLTTGLVSAVGQVTTAATAGNASELESSLQSLAAIRDSTVAQLGSAMRTSTSAMAQLQISSRADLVRDLRSSLASLDETAFDLLDGWREMIASVRSTVEDIDPTEIVAHFEAMLDTLEANATDVLLRGVDGSVEVVKQWLRDLLREVPIRPLRQQLSTAIADVANSIGSADLDAGVDFLRETLRDVSNTINDADPAVLVQAAVDELEAVIAEAINSLAVALSSITDAIDAVAGEAEAILTRAVEGLRDFGDVIEEITAAIDEAGILEAAEDIRRTLGELRDDISTLLSSAPIPDALRTGVEQIIATVESIDLDAAVGEPLRNVAAELQIPEEVATTVRDGLDAVAEAISSLVPADVIADLESMMGDLIEQIEQLDISSLTEGVSAVLDDAAGVFEGVNFTELLEPVGDGFQQLLSTVDNFHPRVLLSPAIDLYDQLLGAIPVPDPETIATRAAEVTSSAGESAARAATDPMRQAVAPDTATDALAEPDGPTPQEPPTDLRPGDVVRLIGFLPAKLKLSIEGLDGDAAGEVIAGINGALSGTATALREVRDSVVGLELAAETALDDSLAPLGAAVLDAQLALQGSAVFESGDTSVDVSYSLLAEVSPASLEVALLGDSEQMRDRAIEAAAGLSGQVADDLDATAKMLDSLVPSGLLADVESLLAALDPEPIAAELDALMVAVLELMPEVITSAEAELRALETRIRGLVDTFNPGTLMQRFLTVLDVLREELALLDPRRLADELGELHAQVRAVLAAYDPVAIAADLDGLLAEVAAAIRGLDPAGMMPDLSGIANQVTRVTEIIPVEALAGVGAQLEAVGEELRDLDITAMIEAVNRLPGEVSDSITLLVEAIRDEIVNLLESIRYSSLGGSESASVGVA